MSVKSTIRSVKHHLINFPGWRTDQKIVIFESDDWGSIRMPSKEVLNSLVSQGIPVDQLSYNRYDTLATEDDLNALFSVLRSFSDKNGNHPVITANTIVANPDFKRIHDNDFSSYYYEPFTQTLKDYPGCERSFDKWREGMTSGIFRPQFHGREHLNVKRWMRALRQDVGNTRLAFRNRLFDLSTSLTITEDSFMEALNLEDNNELKDLQFAIREGLDLFEKIFGYRSATFIAPCYTWSTSLEKSLADAGVKGIQGGWIQKEPIPGEGHQFSKKYHYLGQRNKYGQVYLVRNAGFEPSQNASFDWIDDVLRRMKILFRIGKPVIIGTHRLNFIGSLDPENRNRNLKIFADLLKGMLQKWPDIEFMSSDQLVSLILKE